MSFPSRLLKYHRINRADTHEKCTAKVRLIDSLVHSIPTMNITICDSNYYHYYDLIYHSLKVSSCGNSEKRKGERKDKVSSYL